jgi:probable DNA metabolism protein
MTTYCYDGSFEGLLTVIFRAFEHRSIPEQIISTEYKQLDLLASAFTAATDELLAERVLRGIDKRTDNRGSRLIYRMFLSEQDGAEMTIFHLVKTIVDKGDILSNFGNPYVAKAYQMDKMIGREVHRMHAFVRFQKVADADMYFAIINPACNVLPLIGEHFVKRYADQKWIIWDAVRNYGIYYDLQREIFIEPDHPLLKTLVESSKQEDCYQQLWVDYFNSVNIRERKNTKLHLRHMPKRYWRYLTEKHSR